MLMTVKVILIAPPVFDFYYTPARREHLGLLYIYEALKKNPKIDVKIINALEPYRSKKTACPEHFSYLKKFYTEDTSPFSLFQKYMRFGKSFKAIIGDVIAYNPDLVCISSNFSAYHNDVERLIAAIKNESPAPVAAGGWAINALTDEEISTGNADYYLPGDGEYEVPQLVNAIIKQKNITESKKTYCSIDKNFFYTDFPRHRGGYRFRGMQSAAVIFSRGCPYRCSFCSIHARHTFSQRPLHAIKEELQFLYERGIELVDIEDDNIFHDRSWSQELLCIMKSFHKKGMKFSAMNGMTSANLVNHLDAAIEAGFIEFNISLVTADRELNRSLERRPSHDNIQIIARKSLDRVPVLCFVIGGLPGSDTDSLLEDILFLSDLPLTIGFSPLYLLPGVASLEKMHLPQNNDLLRGSALYRFGDSFTREDIASIWKLVRMINYLKNFTSIDDADEEYLHYFKKSVLEKNWYHQKKDGSWERGFSFTLHIPRFVNITGYKGNRFILPLS